MFEGNNVEVLELNGIVLFNPKDVAKCLDILDVNSSIRDSNENQVVKLTNADMHSMQFRKLNNAGEKFLTEKGIYKLVFKSRKEEALKFQDWVYDEVLPAIRKTGGYVNNDDLFVETYLPFADETTKMLFKNTLEIVKKQNETIQIIKKMEKRCNFASLTAKKYPNSEQHYIDCKNERFEDFDDKQYIVKECSVIR